MADSRFFKLAGPFSLSEMSQASGAEFSSTESADRMLYDVAALDTAKSDDLSFFDNPKYLEHFTKSNAGACFVRAKYADKSPKGMILLISDDPYRAYAKAAAKFYPTSDKAKISAKAYVSESASIGTNCHIESGAHIGDGVVIGDDCRIGANASITHSIIGDRVIIHPNANIGQDGFGFAMGAGGHLKVPQLGRVIIGNDVEIGAGTCIDRGAGPDTTIGEGTKIDNLVQIGHNVQIGKHAVIVSQVGISGSSKIADFVVIGGQAGIAGHLEIGAGAQLAARSGVAKSLEGGKIYGGAPAIAIRDWHRQTAALNKLIKPKPVKTES